MTAPEITPAMAMMIRASWDRCEHEDSGFGVELIGAGPWRVARKLESLELGWIEGGRPNGSDLSGLFFANREAAVRLGLKDEQHGYNCWCDECLMEFSEEPR